MFSMAAIPILSTLLSILLAVTGSRLCEQNGDTFGSWVPSISVDTKQLHQFIHGNANAALLFDMTWIPTNCTYHRFTTQSVNRVLDHLVTKKAVRGIHVVFMGDSARNYVWDRSHFSGFRAVRSKQQYCLWVPSEQKNCIVSRSTCSVQYAIWPAPYNYFHLH